MPEIEIHPSIANIVLEDVLAESLRANRLDPKLLYVTARQAELWREVSRKHSPVHANPEFARIYREAFGRMAEELHAGKIHLVGLGPGTGFKEAELAARLQQGGCDVRFSAIDVSRDLVEESAKRVGATGAAADWHLVCDLAELEFIKKWLDADGREAPRLYTFFGVVPNLEPGFVAKMLPGLLRPGDVLLASVHLAPVGEGVSLEGAMNKILPQYKNAETLAWLREAMLQWKLDELMEEPRIGVSTRGEVPCLLGSASWKSPQTFYRFTGDRDSLADPLFELFFSLRYTPGLFTELLKSAGVQGEMLAMTACREEAIWAVRNGLDSKA
jgi:hypothetical protein